MNWMVNDDYRDEVDKSQNNNKRWNNNWRNNKPKDEGPPVLYKPFAMVTDKEMPNSVADVMRRLGTVLESKGFTPRITGDNQHDEILIDALPKHELYIPWKNFNEKTSKHSFGTEKSKGLISLFIPKDKLDNVKDTAKLFFSRNIRMVLGDKINSPVLFVVGWSKDAAEVSRERTAQSGQLGMFLSIADSMYIPCFNLAKDHALKRLSDYLNIIEIGAINE